MIFHGYENNSKAEENGNRAAGMKYGTSVKPIQNEERGDGNQRVPEQQNSM